MSIYSTRWIGIKLLGVTGQDLVVVNNRFATLAASIMDGDDGRELWLVASVKLLVQLNWLDLSSAATITRVQIGQDLSIDSSWHAVEWHDFGAIGDDSECDEYRYICVYTRWGVCVFELELDERYIFECHRQHGV